MDRRKFVKRTFAAGVAASFPILTACGEKAGVATEAEASVRAVSLDGAEIELTKSMIRELGEAMTGPVMLSEHPGYESARKVWNGMHDKHPALIARCRSTQDIQLAVDFARDNSLLLAVRGGGHSWPGKSTCDGGLMLDLAEMIEVDGLTIDNLLAAEIVTADGQVRQVSADNEPDLFWALQGGGGNFGAVSRFRYQLHPFDRNVLSGLIVWPIEQARDVLEFYAEWQGGLSRELYTGPAMLTHPELGEVIAMEVVYNGDPARGEKELAPLRAVGRPVVDGVIVQDYKVLQTHEDATVAHGIRSYAKNAMIGEFSQGLVDDLIDSFVADPRAALFTHTCGGAVADVAATDTAFPHRDTETMLVFFTGWMDPEQDAEGKSMCRQWHAALERHSLGYYDNIEQEGEARIARNFGPNYDRLQRVKAAHDPGNLFRLNSNIEPAS